MHAAEKGDVAAVDLLLDYAAQLNGLNEVSICHNYSIGYGIGRVLNKSMMDTATGWMDGINLCIALWS